MDNFIKQVLFKTVLYPIPGSIRCVVSHYRKHSRFGDHRYLLNLKSPKTFNEKISWLNLNHRFRDGRIIANKYLVRDYVKKRIGDQYLIPLIDVFDNADEIDYSKLPNQFVLKPNHGSGWVIICTDKSNAETDVFNMKLDRWLGMDFYYLSGEWHYKDLEKKIVCEELIQELQNIVDYKFYCFNGEPRIVQVDFDRHTNHTRSFYDLNWDKMDLSLLYPPSEKDMPRPKGLDEMIEVAKTLSSEFTFCRVDLYDVDGKVYFGEITLHPEAGTAPFGSYEQDLKLGQMLNLNHLQN